MQLHTYQVIMSRHSVIMSVVQHAITSTTGSGMVHNQISYKYHNVILDMAAIWYAMTLKTVVSTIIPGTVYKFCSTVQNVKSASMLVEWYTIPLY